MFYFNIKTKDICKKSNEILNPLFKSYILGTLNDMGYFFDFINQENNVYKIHKTKISDISRINNIFKKYKYYKVDKIYKTLITFNNKIASSNYLLLSVINDQKVVMLINTNVIMFIPVPYIFTDDLYDRVTIFKCFKVENNIYIYDISVYRGNILDNDLEEKIKLLKQIRMNTLFDLNHTYINFYDIKIINYEEVDCLNEIDSIYVPKISSDKSKIYIYN